MSAQVAEQNSPPALACLRVVIHGLFAEGSDKLKGVVSKLVTAFLETRWVWPRHFEQMTAYAFVLTDPRALVLDKEALRHLSAELQLKLFGVEGEGEVTLMVFEGAEVDVYRFARLTAEDIARMLGGAVLDPPLEGELNRLTAAGVASITPVPAADAKASSPAAAKFGALCPPAYMAVCFLPQERVIGSYATRRQTGVALPCNYLTGPYAMPDLTAEVFDECCVDSAINALDKGPPDGQVFVPLSFSSLARPAGRQAYAGFLSRLPAALGGRLTASIYDTPRDPSFFALSTIESFLRPYFRRMNLQVSDPGFGVEKLPLGTVQAVTLTLQGQDPAARLSAIRRFMQQREAFKKRRVWPGIGNVASLAELEVCRSLRTPIISGPAVSEPATLPMVMRDFSAGDLPLR